MSYLNLILSREWFMDITINLVKEELHDNFVEKTKEEFRAKFGRNPKVYEVVISDGSRRLL